jgi:hypothetical protein
MLTQTQTQMRATDWRPLQRGSLQGFVTLHLPSGLVIRDCTLHQSGEKRWVGLPGKPQIDASGATRRNDSGKVLYTPVIDIVPSARERFQTEALRAVDCLIH